MTVKDDDDRYDFEDDENEESRSIFSATWFRVVLATVGVGVIAAVALPYLLGGGTPAPEKSASAPPPLLDTKPAASLATSPAPESAGPLVTVTPPPASAPLATSAPATAHSLPAAAMAPAPAPDRAAVAVAAPAVQAKRPAPRPVAQVRPAAAKSVKATPATRKGYWVQVGTFRDPAAARRLAAKLRDQKHSGPSRPVTVADSGDRLSRVQVGPFADRASASTTVRSLQAQGFRPFVVNRGA